MSSAELHPIFKLCFSHSKDHEKIYIQVALRIDNEATARRDFGNLLKIQDNYPKIVVTSDPYIGNSYEGIRHYPIRDFLSGF